MLFPPRASDLKPQRHLDRMLTILRFYARNGRKLADLTSPDILDRSLDCLKRYCRAGDIVFPDYMPRRLRCRTEPKRTKRRRPSR